MEGTKEFRIQVSSEESDFLRLLWYLKRRRLISIFLLIVAISSCFAFVILNGKPIDPTNDRRWMGYLLVIFLPLLASATIYFALRGQAKKMRSSSGNLSAYFNEDGIELDGINATSSAKWSAFDKVVETSTDFIFYMPENICYAIPKRFFDNSSEIDDLKGFLRNALGEGALLR